VLTMFDPRRGDLGAIVEALRLRGAYYTPTPRSRLENLVVRPLARTSAPAAALRLWRARRRPPSLRWAGPKLRAFLASHQEKPGPEGNTYERIAAMLSSSYALDIFDGRAHLELSAGCEHAAPFADPELVDFVLSLPADTFFAGGYFRGLLREAMRGLVPDEVRLRATKWFPAHSLGDIFRAAGGIDALRPHVNVAALGDLGLVEPRAFAARFEEFSRRPFSPLDWAELWPAVAIEALVSSAAGVDTRVSRREERTTLVEA